MQSANWLATNSALYRDQGVSFSEDRAASYSVNLSQNETDRSLSQDNDQINNSCNVENTAIETEHLNDDWTEDDAEIPARVTDTMFTATGFLEDSERVQIYNIAPGEGSTPLSIFRDKYSEELAYPGIFLGQKRPGPSLVLSSTPPQCRPGYQQKKEGGSLPCWVRGPVSGSVGGGSWSPLLATSTMHVR